MIHLEAEVEVVHLAGLEELLLEHLAVVAVRRSKNTRLRSLRIHHRQRKGLRRSRSLGCQRRAHQESQEALVW